MTQQKQIARWEPEVEVATSPNSQDHTFTQEEWLNALEQDGGGLEEWLRHPHDTYHARHNGYLVGFKFNFEPGQDGKTLVAQATCHPAWRARGENLTDTDETVAQAELRITLHDPRALREALEEMGYPEEE